MTAEEFYEEEFGNAKSIPKENVIRLLKHFAKVLEIEHSKVSYIAGGKIMIYGKIKKLERNLEGHSYTCFEVGKEISEILDITESKAPHLQREFEIRYTNGIVKELIGGIFTVERFPVSNGK